MRSLSARRATLTPAASSAAAASAQSTMACSPTAPMWQSRPWTCQRRPVSRRRCASSAGSGIPTLSYSWVLRATARSGSSCTSCWKGETSTGAWRRATRRVCPSPGGSGSVQPLTLHVASPTSTTPRPRSSTATSRARTYSLVRTVGRRSVTSALLACQAASFCMLAATLLERLAMWIRSTWRRELSRRPARSTRGAWCS
mmetsp:Transcript_66894/g.199037  ORF Transcript_66894/g.199037 Transcript_66894/m.199037 type:complete len:200 (-) Transcript_66894:581-1180(-)